jgi:hypothetical protein
MNPALMQTGRSQIKESIGGLITVLLIAAIHLLGSSIDFS